MLLSLQEHRYQIQTNLSSDQSGVVSTNVIVMADNVVTDGNDAAAPAPRRKPPMERRRSENNEEDAYVRRETRTLSMRTLETIPDNVALGQPNTAAMLSKMPSALMLPSDAAMTAQAMDPRKGSGSTPSSPTSTSPYGRGDIEATKLKATHHRMATYSEDMLTSHIKLMSQTHQACASLTRHASFQRSSRNVMASPTPEGHEPLPSHNDESHLFFSIETRLELKERVAVVQKKLDNLLLQTKLAWMRCFTHDVHNTLAASRESINMAAALVDKGEELASHMQLVIAHARGNDSIDKFKKVVEYIELEILDFERLVQLIAHTELPPSNQPQEHVSPPPTAASTTATVSQDPKSIPPANSPARGAAVSYDLPSMKQYCEKVAPSYTAYLKPKATRSRFARR